MVTKYGQDSIYIQQVQDHKGPDQVLHAEPLYMDLIRDLGARKGEPEWNVGLGLTDNLQFDSYQALIEYEWAPIDLLGFEVELLLRSMPRNANPKELQCPPNRLNSLKIAGQRTFFVNEPLGDINGNPVRKRV